MKMNKIPIAFMSYTHFDDEHNRGNLSTFCEEFSKEVRAQTGEEFQIFHDIKDIGWGEKWEERIENSLDTVIFFIPIITPSFFKSDYCRNELNKFLEREAKLQRTDLILPVYYIKCTLIENNKKLENDKLAEIIVSRQYFDWRELRFLSFEDQIVRKALAKLAEKICDALERTKCFELRKKDGDIFYLPKQIEKGREQFPLKHLSLVKSFPDPYSLLEEAMEKRQQGDYEAAKNLHTQLIQLGIDWSKHIDLFVDLLYFSISLHDKLEEWNELENLDRLVFTSAFSKIAQVITSDAYNTVIMMYQTSMALAMLRQTKLENAFERIEEALKAFPNKTADKGSWILYANALTTRALILHSSWQYKDADQLKLLKADNDLKEARPLYEKYAEMGKSGEFHHLGRYYGTRAFLYLALWKSKLRKKLNISKLLTDSNLAHVGNRTAYGTVAGYYCDAYCKYEIALQKKNKKEKQQYCYESLHLLMEAGKSVSHNSTLAKFKIYSLARIAAKKLQELNEGFGLHNYNIENLFSNAKKSILKRGHNFLENIDQQKWLGTPLN